MEVGFRLMPAGVKGADQLDSLWMVACGEICGGARDGGGSRCRLKFCRGRESRKGDGMLQAYSPFSHSPDTSLAQTSQTQKQKNSQSPNLPIPPIRSCYSSATHSHRPACRRCLQRWRPLPSAFFFTSKYLSPGIT
ncbi:hypothetical protein SLA2020_146860 [Shorea laevis]